MKIITNKFIFTALFTVSVVFTFSQRHQADSLTTIVTAMEKSNVYEASYTIGYAGTVSKQYQRFEQLAALATEQQLLTTEFALQLLWKSI